MNTTCRSRLATLLTTRLTRTMLIPVHNTLGLRLAPSATLAAPATPWAHVSFKRDTRGTRDTLGLRLCPNVTAATPATGECPTPWAHVSPERDTRDTRDTLGLRLCHNVTACVAPRAPAHNLYTR